MAKMLSDNKVLTGKVRLSYVRLITPKENDQGKDVWSVLLLIPKSDRSTLKCLQTAAEAALKTGISNGKLKKGATLKNEWTTLKDGDERDDLDEAPEYADHWYMNVNAYRRPQVVDRQKDPILDEADIYSGCYGRLSISAYPFKVPSNHGITFGIEIVQFLEDGEPLGGAGRANVDEDLDDLDDEDSPI